MTAPQPDDDAADPVTAAAAPQPGVEQYRAAVRRAPKLAVFLVLGGLLGAIVALILTVVHGAGTTQSSDSTISDNGLWVAVVFFFSIAIGVAVGGVVALVLDRASRRRVAIVTVERGVVERDVNEGAAEASAAPANEGSAPDSEVAENSSPDAGGRV